MVPGANLMSLDDFCEKHNSEQKKCPKYSYFLSMCSSSKHLHTAMRAAKGRFECPVRETNVSSSMEEHVDIIYSFYSAMGVFTDQNTKSSVTNNTFWNEVVP